MASVDPADDTVLRFVVQHFRYDAERRERRHVIVAAFDDEEEFRACLDGLRQDLSRSREQGELADPREHASGVVREPGYLRRTASQRLIMRAIRHRATSARGDEPA